MEKESVVLQPELVERFQQAFLKGHLSHAYLFEGPVGTGKSQLALWLAQHLFCTHLLDNQPCGQCDECVRIASGNHPDVLFIQPDGATIKVDQIRFLRDEFSKSGVEGSQKIFIVTDAEKMTTSAANSLLKFLEEPVGNSMAILLTSMRHKMLSTILSRCQIVEFKPLSREVLVHNLLELGLNERQAALFSSLTNSSVEAQTMAENEELQAVLTLGFQWFQKIIQKQGAFVMVQQEILPLTKERRFQDLFLDVVLLAYHDLLTLSYQQKRRLTFDQDRVLFEKLRQKVTIQQLIIAIEYVLKAKQKLGSNVAFQNVCEQLVIRLAME